MKVYRQNNSVDAVRTAVNECYHQLYILEKSILLILMGILPCFGCVAESLADVQKVNVKREFKARLHHAATGKLSLSTQQ